MRCYECEHSTACPVHDPEMYQEVTMPEPIPVQMNVKEIISWFEDLPLTNFYPGKPIDVSDVPWPGTYMTAEHAFQAQKSLSGADALYVQASKNAAQAKQRGRHVKLRPDWQDIKDDVMRAILRAKFTTDRDEGLYLLSTGDAKLIEGTTWNDQYWGVDITSPNRPGMNRLGILLMERRAELLAQVKANIDRIKNDL